MVEPQLGAAGAPAYWGAKAAEYDDFIRRVVPRYDEMVERLLETLPASATNVLELGCGTGQLSAQLLDRLPDATFALVDAAPEMLEITRARLAIDTRALDRVQFVADRFEDLDLAPGEYDLVVASISLHHVAEPDPVYRMLRRGLTPGGALRVADGFAGVTPQLHAIHMRRWADYWIGRLSPDEIASVRDHVERHDHYFDIATHFRMLRDAGFTDCDCTWRDGLFGVIVADA